MYTTSLVVGAVYAFVVFIGHQCYEISVHETSGIHDDGVVLPGHHFSIHCSGLTQIPVVMSKRQPRLHLGQSELILAVHGSPHRTASERFTFNKTQENGKMTYIARTRADGDGAQLTDTGRYGCYVDNKEPTTYKAVSVMVVGDIKTHQLFGTRDSKMLTGSPMHTRFYNTEGFVGEDGDEFYFRCEASGSNPAADMRVLYGGEDITEKFNRSVTFRWIAANPSPELEHYAELNYDVQLVSNEPLKINYANARKEIVCNATMDGMKDHVISVLPLIRLKPEVKCSDVRARHGQASARLECTVRSDPMLTAVRFSFFNGSARVVIREGESRAGMNVTSQTGERAGEHIYALVLSVVHEDTFRQYTFHGQGHDGQVNQSASLILYGGLYTNDNNSQAFQAKVLSSLLLFMPFTASLLYFL